MKEQPRDSYNPEAKALFEEHLKGKNLMTPQIVRYGVGGRYAYELSEGTGFKREPIFGVTVLRRVTGARCDDLSRMFYSRDEAEAWIEEIKGFGGNGP